MSPRSASKVIVTASEETTIMDNATLSDLNRRQPFEPEMILIPAGEFLMGSDPSVDKDTIVDEQPQHHLYLPDFYIAKTPTTNAQYAAFVLSADHEALSHWEDRRPLQGQEDHFVVNVSWYDAVAYCNWLSDVTGKAYRLPSEAEWEKAARGTDGRIYPWGNEYDISLFGAFAYPGKASPRGVLEMASNVWEWTRSLYKDYPYDPTDGREDLEADGSRALRGGWIVAQVVARAACRLGGLNPNKRNESYGFRVVVSLA